MDEGQTKPLLFSCDDGNQYVVKFMSNPCGAKVLVHEFIASELAKALGLPVADGKIIYFSSELIDQTPELQKLHVQPGVHFGSLFYDPITLPKGRNLLQNCVNLYDMPGIMVFDHWICNRDRANNHHNLLVHLGEDHHKLYMIDHASSFYSTKRSGQILRESAPFMDVFWGDMYQQFKPLLTDKGLFDTYIQAIEAFPNEEIERIVNLVPKEWEPDQTELDALVQYLIFRKSKLHEPIGSILNKLGIPI
jgi:hypothetical protein